MSDTPKTDDFAECWERQGVRQPLADFARELERENARLRKAAQHCRLFLADRKGYYATESDERKSIISELDDILSNIPMRNPEP